MTDDYISASTEAGDVLVRRDSLDAIAAVDGIVFDIDGVLIDVRDSIRLVHGGAAEIYFSSLGWTNCRDLVEPGDVDAFKLAGGFNSDWDIADVWLLVYLLKSARLASTDGAVLKAVEPALARFAREASKSGRGLENAVDAVRSMCGDGEWGEIEPRWDREGLRRVFVEVYSGDLCPEVYGFEPKVVTGPGMMRRDKPILDRRLLPSACRFGIATGRTAGETVVGLRLAGWSDVFPRSVIVSEDDGFRKPDPRILALAVERLGANRPMYIGDTPDDLLTVHRYQENGRRMPACTVLTGMDDSGARERFIRRKADMIADNVNAALAAFQLIRGGALCPAEQQR